MTIQPALLFDIDGTLLTAGMAGRIAMNAAAAALGVAPDDLPSSFAGRTDRGIAEHALGEAYNDETFARFEAAYLAALPAALATSATSTLPGVVARLVELAPRAHLGLCTGNTAAGARLKLQHVGLWHHFAFGGYGDDAIARHLVVRHALMRAAAHAGCGVHELPAVVIGDTPKDIAAAHAAGLPCVAVATGPYDFDFLAALGADAVLGDLDQTAAGELILTMARPVRDH
ncbi:MAG: phosphoglycolate phosphatase [Bradymonadia bacterium]